jgi:hypothetical protein
MGLLAICGSGAGERAFNLAVQQLQQNTMVNFVKETFQVNIHNMIDTLH